MMDMQLNKEILKSEREKRAWSQSHLAEVAGLSMRTVQRIERTGSASFESAKALASALDTHVEQLSAFGSATASSTYSRRSTIAARCSTIAAISASVLLGFTWWSAAFAEPIMIDLSVSNNDRVLANVQLLNDEGEQSEMQIDGVLKVQIRSTNIEGKVKLATQIFEYTNSDYKLKAEPKIISANNETAEIHFDAENGETYQLRFTPHL